MSYASGHPVRLVGGRLALDFANTADWSEDGRVTHEKILSLADLRIWLDALGLGSVKPPDDVSVLRSFRAAIRELLRGRGDCGALRPGALLRVGPEHAPSTIARQQPLETLIAASALSILADRREVSRLKMCPGVDCGWLFIDETKNARRRWCMMETCGNRAKSARHYARRTRDQDGGG